MSQVFFVTGTDTEIGKTTIAAGLLHAARLAGLSTAAAKPVASGCTLTPQGLRNDDALALLGECTLALRYEEVNPLAFEPAIAPHLAAREVGVLLDVAALQGPVQAIMDNFGGWRALRLYQSGAVDGRSDPARRPAVGGLGGKRGRSSHFAA